MHFYRKCWFDPFEEQFISPLFPDCPSLMLGIAIHCIYNILKQCWSVGYVSLLTFSFILPKIKLKSRFWIYEKVVFFAIFLLYSYCQCMFFCCHIHMYWIFNNFEKKVLLKFDCCVKLNNIFEVNMNIYGSDLCSCIFGFLWIIVEELIKIF